MNSPDYKFEGTHAAIVTPLKTNDGMRRGAVLEEESQIDFDAFRDQVNRLALAGVHITVHGTTGQSPTMSDNDYRTLVRESMDAAEGRVDVIAGSGSNNTSHALKMTDIAAGEGVAGVLSVTPYYNKPPQRGIVEHNRRIADVGLPTVVYDIEGRSGVPVKVDTMAELYEHDSIVAVKDASGDVNKTDQLRRKIPGLTILTGNDDMIAGTVAPGKNGSIRGNGVISVVANAAPEITKRIVDEGLAGNTEEAQRLQELMNPLLKALYAETNPMGIHALMEHVTRVGDQRVQMNDILRLPMMPMTDEDRERLIHEWEQFTSSKS